MNDAQMTLLVAELTTSTHPTTLTYDVDKDLAAAELMDENIPQIKSTMTGDEIWNEIDIDELDGLTAEQRDEIISFCAIDNHNSSSGGQAQTFLLKYFVVDSETIIGLIAARLGAVSQASLLGLGTVTGQLVAQARGEL